MARPFSGGATVSSDPESTSAGARIRPRWAVASHSSSASQQPAYPSRWTAQNAARNAATTSGFAAANAGVNHRPSTASTTASVPPARTAAARSRHISGVANRLPADAITSRSTRSGALAAIHVATAPPIERPHTDTRSSPSRSSSSSASPASSAMVYGPCGAGVPPCPRWS